MKTIRILPVALAVVLAAFGARPAQAQAPAAAVDPVGMYDFEASLGIEMRTGTLEIERSAEGQLTGEAWLEGESVPAVIQSGTVEGSHVVLNALVNGASHVIFRLDFAESEFSGVIQADGNEITVDGTRRAVAP